MISLKESIKYLEKNITDWTSIAWESPSNIALIKYWGKKKGQTPCNPSLSMTLKKASTKTAVYFKLKENNEEIDINLFINKTRNIAFEEKIKKLVCTILPGYPFLHQLQIKIITENSFPHSAGIASSASAMSALALCFCEMEQQFFGTIKNTSKFFQKASSLSRLGSGSASRSVYGGFVSWGKSPHLSGSSNAWASPVKEVHPIFQTYKNAILLVDTMPKAISSSKGHLLMQGHPFAKGRYEEASKNFIELLDTLKKGDEKTFIQIVENEALSLHALLLSSKNNLILLHPNSIHIINKIKTFREQTALNLCFTIDAGPNIHLLYSSDIAMKVKPFIENELLPYCENQQWIDDEIGNGPIPQPPNF